MADLGVGWYRFSLAWPRMQPDGRGALNDAGLDFYARLVDALLAKGITPWVTLYHWDLPQALEDAGGWPERDTAERFADYAARRATSGSATGSRTGRRSTSRGARRSSATRCGAHAPGRTDAGDALAAAHHLMLGHGLGVDAHARPRDADRAVRHHAQPEPVRSGLGRARPTSTRPAASTAWPTASSSTRCCEGAYPDDVLADIARRHRLVVRAGRRRASRSRRRSTCSASTTTSAPSCATAEDAGARRRSGLGGTRDIDPSRARPARRPRWAGRSTRTGSTTCSPGVARDYPGVPLYVTENGAAFADVDEADGAVHDPDRIDYLRAPLRAPRSARSRAGVDLRGYFVWSLLDNFEWAYGYSKRFGIVHVDYDTHERTPKDSAQFYAAGHAGERRCRRSQHAVVADLALLAHELEREAAADVRAGGADHQPDLARLARSGAGRRPVNAVRSACSGTSRARARPARAATRSEARELDDRPGHRRDRVGQVELDDLGARALARVAHDARDLDLAVGGDLLGAEREVRRTSNVV